MKPGKLPIISVIMISHNHGAFVGEAVESILNQSFSDFEFLVVDDGSTDATPDIVQDYASKDPRMKLVRIPPCTQAHALNVGMQMAQGDYLAFMDSDDISLPDRLETQYAWIRETGCDLCGSEVETFGTEQKHYWYPEMHDVVCLEQLFRVSVITGAMMMRASVVRENPYREDIMLVDYEWPTRISFHCRLGNVPEVLLKRRRHENQASVLHSEQCAKEFSKIHFHYFYSLFPQASLTDYLSLFRIARNQPMTSLPEMERAGQWLVELSKHPDRHLRQRMSLRWEQVSERSSWLVCESRAIYSRYQAQMINRYEIEKHVV